MSSTFLGPLHSFRLIEAECYDTHCVHFASYQMGAWLMERSSPSASPYYGSALALLFAPI